MAETTFYVQVVPKYNWYYKDRLDSVTPVRMTKEKPKTPVPGGVVVKMRLNVPDKVFEPFPTVDVAVQAEHVQATPTAVSEPVDDELAVAA